MGRAARRAALVTDAPPASFRDALAALAATLDALDTPSLIIGGIAVIALGVPRATVDIDATLSASAVNLDRLLEIGRRFGLSPRIDDALAFARAQQVVLLRHDASGIPIDISLASLPFEEEAIRSGVNRDFAGVRIRVARPEDLVIYKLVAFRPRDIDDAEALLIAYGADVDVARVREVVRQFADVLEDHERPVTLERLLTKAGFS